MDVMEFPFGKGSGNIIKKYLDKGHRCGKCKSNDITVLINEGVKLYTCDKCNRTACNPRIFYNLKEEYCNNEKIKEIMGELCIPLDVPIFYRGKLAILVAVLKDFLDGGEGYSKNINQLGKHGKPIIFHAT